MGLRGPNSNRQRWEKASRTPLKKPSRRKTVLSRQEAVIQFIEQFKITKGMLTGKKFRVRPFQRDIIRSWYRTGKGNRRIVTTGVFSVGRKNGKTSTIAGLAGAHLVGPETVPRGEIVVGASDRDQSGIIFDELVALLEQKRQYREIINIKSHEKKIINLANGSTFHSLSSDAKKAHGLNPSVVILDELAQWGDGIGRRLYDALVTSQAAWREPLLLIIGTQAASDHSIMSNLIDYGMSVRSGDIEDPTFSAFLYEIPDDVDVFDEENWKLANPALGDFRSLDDMRRLAQKSRRIPSMEATFRNLYCNQRVDAEERWLSAVEWKPSIDHDIDIDSLAGEYCIGGLDLSSVRDLTAFALFFPNQNILNVWTFCPADNLKIREERDRVPYTSWADQGFIIPTPGSAINKSFIAMKLDEICSRFAPEHIAFDRWGTQELRNIMEQEGISLSDEEDFFVDFGQGYKSMSPATKVFEAKVVDQVLRTPYNPVLTWAISNVAISRDAADNKKPNKERSREKIDPAIASIMAVGQSAIQEGGMIEYSGMKSVSA